MMLYYILKFSVGGRTESVGRNRKEKENQSDTRQERNRIDLAYLFKSDPSGSGFLVTPDNHYFKGIAAEDTIDFFYVVSHGFPPLKNRWRK